MSALGQGIQLRIVLSTVRMKNYNVCVLEKQQHEFIQAGFIFNKIFIMFSHCTLAVPHSDKIYKETNISILFIFF